MATRQQDEPPGLGQPLRPPYSVIERTASPCRTRTCTPPVNSRLSCRSCRNAVTQTKPASGNLQRRPGFPISSVGRADRHPYAESTCRVGRMSQGACGRTLDELVSEMEGPVEVVLRPARIIESEKKNGSLLDLLAHLPAGTRTKVDIDQQIREEREDWGRS